MGSSHLLHILLGSAGLAVAAVSVTLTSIALLPRSVRSSTCTVDGALTVALLSIAQVVLVCSALGYTGVLRAGTILACHMLTLAAAALPRRSMVAGWTVRTYRRMTRRAVCVRRWSPLERVLGLSAAVLCVGSVLVALSGEPMVHDTLAYRLSRIGHWLQEGSISHFAANDARQSLSAFNGDLVMLWLSCWFPTGYPLVKLVQVLGACLLTVSLAAFARELRCGRLAILGGLWVVLSAPNVVTQLTTAQVDLFVSGLSTAGIYLMFRALRRGRGVLPPSVALALAVGTKGSVLYLGVGIAAMVPFWWYLKPSLRTIGRAAAVGAVCMVVLASPRYVENALRFHNPFGPQHMHEFNTGTGGLSLRKLTLNVGSYAIQTLEPASNPWPLSAVVRPMWQWLVNRVPLRDPYANPLYPRRQSLGIFGGSTTVNADTAQCGVLAVSLALAAIVVLFVRAPHSPPARYRQAALSGVAACLAGFILLFSASYQWFPTNGRFFIMGVPLLALLATYLFDRLRGVWSVTLVAATATLGAISVVKTSTASINSGLATVDRASRERLQYLRELDIQKDICRTFSSEQSLGVSIRMGSVLSGLYRNGPQQPRILSIPTPLVQNHSAAETMATYGLAGLVVRPTVRLEPGPDTQVQACVDPQTNDIRFVLFRAHSPSD